MKPGSLVTLAKRYTLDDAPPDVRSYIKNMPVFGEIYTVQSIQSACDCECGYPHVILEEMETLVEEGKDVGFPMPMYVEVQPPQENVQSMLDSIIKHAPVRELV